MIPFKDFFSKFRREPKQKVLIIMRGIPGSGKSYTAKQLAPLSHIFSTDNYWGPKYNFKLELIGTAHKWNQEKVTKAMDRNVSPIVIDNTNVTWREARPYVEQGLQHGYTVLFREPDLPEWKEIVKRIERRSYTESDADFLFKNNTHQVPRETIVNMMQRWAPTSFLERKTEERKWDLGLQNESRQECLSCHGRGAIFLKAGIPNIIVPCPRWRNISDF